MIRRSFHRGKRQEIIIFFVLSFIVESNIERIMFKSGDNFIPVTAASGTLVRLNGHTLEMLIWFILHEQRKFVKKNICFIYACSFCVRYSYDQGVYRVLL